MTHNLLPYAIYKKSSVLWGGNVLPSEEELRAELVREQRLIAENMTEADDGMDGGQP